MRPVNNPAWISAFVEDPVPVDSDSKCEVVALEKDRTLSKGPWGLANVTASVDNKQLTELPHVRRKMQRREPSTGYTDTFCTCVDRGTIDWVPRSPELQTLRCRRRQRNSRTVKQMQKRSATSLSGSLSVGRRIDFFRGNWRTQSRIIASSRWREKLKNETSFDKDLIETNKSSKQKDPELTVAL